MEQFLLVTISWKGVGSGPGFVLFVWQVSYIFFLDALFAIFLVYDCCTFWNLTPRSFRRPSIFFGHLTDKVLLLKGKGCFRIYRSQSCSGEFEENVIIEFLTIRSDLPTKLSCLSFLHFLLESSHFRPDGVENEADVGPSFDGWGFWWHFRGHLG